METKLETNHCKVIFQEHIVPVRITAWLGLGRVLLLIWFTSSDATSCSRLWFFYIELQPIVNDHFDSLESATVSSTMSTSSTSRQRALHSNHPNNQALPHSTDQKSEIVNRVHPQLRISTKWSDYEIANQMNGSRANYQQAPRGRSINMVPEIWRQRSEPPMVTKVKWL